MVISCTTSYRDRAVEKCGVGVGGASGLFVGSGSRLSESWEHGPEAVINIAVLIDYP